MNRRLRNKSLGFVKPPEFIQDLADFGLKIGPLPKAKTDPDSCEPKVKPDPDGCEPKVMTEPDGCELTWVIWVAHDDMVRLFLARSSNDNVNSSFDLLQPATRDYLRGFE